MKPLFSTAKRLGLYLGIALLGFLAGAHVLYVLWALNGPPLQPWHEIELAGEFTADQADEVRTLADYQALEARLYAELDEEVYSQTPQGPDQALVRFSAGSASDPRARVPNWNLTYEIVPPDPRAGVLLLHGMSDGPYSLRALGEALGQAGYRVLGLRLPGHGVLPSGLLTVTWEDLAAATRLGMAHLTGVMPGKPIHLVGYSMGSALALDYSLNVHPSANASTSTGASMTLPQPASLVLISPAVGLARIADLTPWVERLGRLPGLERLAWTAIMPEFDPFRFNSFTANASLQVHRMTQDLTARVRRLAAKEPLSGFPPTLVLLSAVDATVSAQAVADSLLRHLAPEGHELVLYDINRFALDAPLVVADAGDLTKHLLADATLPFAVTFVRNLNPDSREVLAEQKPPFTAGFATSTPLAAPWPEDVIALSHVALPFPPEDPLYGRYPPEDPGQVFLGQLAIRGENGVLKLPGNWLLRQRHNPFYEFQQGRILDWLGHDPSAPSADSPVRDGGPG